MVDIVFHVTDQNNFIHHVDTDRVVANWHAVLQVHVMKCEQALRTMQKVQPDALMAMYGQETCAIQAALSDQILAYAMLIAVQILGVTDLLSMETKATAPQDTHAILLVIVCQKQLQLQQHL